LAEGCGLIVCPADLALKPAAVAVAPWLDPVVTVVVPRNEDRQLASKVERRAPQPHHLFWRCRLRRRAWTKSSNIAIV